MQHLPRKLALATATVALTVPTLASCGFDYATDRVYNPGVGTNDRDSVVDVLAGVIVSEQPDEGIFVASLANNSNDEAFTFESLSGPMVEAAPFEPVEVPPAELVDLADEGGLEVTGDFEAGQFVEVTLGFASGDEVTLEVPVVPNEGDYAGLGPLPEPTESPSESESHESGH